MYYIGYIPALYLCSVTCNVRGCIYIGGDFCMGGWTMSEFTVLICVYVFQTVYMNIYPHITVEANLL